ncbi:hypothetical protein ACM2W4_16355 (plasmid) [Enterococcus casseliflavus]|nr:hypothetical protein [Enterococcus casseliflavus]QOG30144.1 XRE family transcriptional regulator [Enterococcus casseliflavus]RHH59871.1 XRE family transcriptional regulator [Enterococcus casseliflavus]
MSASVVSKLGKEELVSLNLLVKIAEALDVDDIVSIEREQR